MTNDKNSKEKQVAGAFATGSLLVVSFLLTAAILVGA